MQEQAFSSGPTNEVNKAMSLIQCFLKTRLFAAIRKAETCQNEIYF